MNFLEVNNVSFTYPGQKIPVVKNLSFQFSSSGLYGIAGSNGSGKSTLLRCICGLEDVSQGNIYLNGDKITGPSRNSIPGHPAVKLISQEKKLEPAIRVEENISRKLLGYQLKFRKEKTDFLLSKSGLKPYKNKFPEELSGGQMQMLSIVCALAEEPKLLLLDEPFVSLDVFARESMIEYLSSLLKELNVGMILVSHDPRDLLGYTERILVLRKGKLIMNAEPGVIFNFPEDEYCAGLFGPYSVLSAKETEKIYRPSEIIISLSGKFSFQVTKRIFKGDYYEIIAVNKKKETIVAYDFSGMIFPGKIIKVDLKKMR